MIIGKCTDVFRGIFWLGGAVEKKGFCGGNFSMEEFVMGEENFHEGGGEDFLVLFKKKNYEKINMKKFF